MGRRIHSSEFKLEAAKLVRERGVTIAQAARDLDIHANVLRKWLEQYDAEGAKAYTEASPAKAEHQELVRLRKEVERLKMERDILKKAAQFFAKESK